ncbi:diacylglycerol kinase [Dyadobacter luteus]|uniref:Diacylglycerol kinase n=1 Tax=Dyadobacter luteus TaxID=2259619 RepID=A0A3D8Y8V3_9BACT|nr:diacylglycerol kinase family protein [Dyadobacter luteus]REA59781.1 diacylglycerol kinase [Dyadobacter luteus]
MKKATLLHNPTAGEKDFSKSELMELIKKQGFECTYESVKQEGWDDFSNKSDFLIVAGGDGTVRRAAKALVKRRLIDKQFPIALLPHGTANNIAGTLGITGKAEEIIKSWQQNNRKSFDVGKVSGLEKDMFFLEAFGCGIFPRLIKVMEKMEDELGKDVDEKLKAAQAVLYDVVLNYKPRQCRIIADGSEHSGKYIMIEVINTRSIGPNLQLANGDPGDGEFEIVLIPAEHQQKFEQFLLSQINGGGEDEFSFTTLKAKNIRIEWEDGKDIHVDDERVKSDKPVTINIEVLPGLLEFMVPNSES